MDHEDDIMVCCSAEDPTSRTYERAEQRDAQTSYRRKWRCREHWRADVEGGRHKNNNHKEGGKYVLQLHTYQ